MRCPSGSFEAWQRLAGSTGCWAAPLALMLMHADGMFIYLRSCIFINSLMPKHAGVFGSCLHVDSSLEGTLLLHLAMLVQHSLLKSRKLGAWP